MTTIQELQFALQQSGRYGGLIDGAYGPVTGAAVLMAMTDGPDTRLRDVDFDISATRLGVQVAAIKAVAAVEASGAGFSAGRPVLLFEPHRFSRATHHQFDAAYPSVSYPKWDKAKYPASQAARYAQLIKAVGLDVDAGFASASYGKFQILGENFAACGFSSSFDFAQAQAFDEAAQLKAFEGFLNATGLVKKLRALDFDGFAAGYNGTAWRANDYGNRLRSSFRGFGGRA